MILKTAVKGVKCKSVLSERAERGVNKVESCLKVNVLTEKVFNVSKPCNFSVHYHYNKSFLYQDFFGEKIIGKCQ